MAIIEVEHVTKEYRLGAMQSLKSIASRMMGRSPSDSNNFKALDDINFTIEKGEVVGIIGHNGAGKSTLLKLLSRITTQTSGRIAVHGKIAPLIEVGAGLVGDMTGRENIYLNASILGMRREEVDRKVDGIIAFSELEKFIDTPVKRYSSGMQVRLGYAIAIEADFDILIVDEVLAVGDLQFQRKSLARMQTLIRDTHRTVLIVGHNVRQLERVCSRIILMDAGKIVADGLPTEITNLFFERIQDRMMPRQQGKGDTGNSKWIVESSGELEVHHVSLRHHACATDTTEVCYGDEVTIEIEIEAKRCFDRVDLGVAFLTLDHLPVAISPLTSALPVPMTIEAGMNRFQCTLPVLYLLPGVYCLRLGIKDGWGQMLWGGDNLSPFIVRAPSGANTARFSDYAFVQFPGKWSHICESMSI